MKNYSLPARWARELLAAMIAAGVRRFFVCPGARSVPLAHAIAEAASRGEIGTMVHFDERGAAFAALGAAHATGEPSAVVTTSGSAVANLLPACVEARYSGIPLLLVTADRPPELRGTGANQTIEQPGIFGEYVVRCADFPAPSESLLPLVAGWVRQLLAPLFAPWPGPVHLNLPFREPLLPRDEQYIHTENLQSPGGKSHTERDSHLADLAAAIERLASARRGIIVVGEIAPFLQTSEWNEILRFATYAGWPVIADALSGGKGRGGVLQHAELLLRCTGWEAPDFILHLGGRIVSRAVQELVFSAGSSRILQIRSGPDRIVLPGTDPFLLRMRPSEFCREIRKDLRAGWGADWAAGWMHADQKIAAFLAQRLDESENDDALTEPGLARCAVALAARSSAPLFCANSMPVRDVELFGGSAVGEAPVILGQRGASGIDGNIAHVAGFAMATRHPVIALLGDLAVLHDLNSLVLLRELPVTLLIANNGGGGIFRFLPFDLPKETRERFLETPHSFSFAAACQQFGLAYFEARSTRDLRALLLPHPSPAVVEIHTHRAENYKLHTDLVAECKNLFR